MRIPIESLDLAELTASLRDRFAGTPLVGYLDGRTALRDAAAAELCCSELEAEQIVDTLVTRGFIRYEGDPGQPFEDARPWSFAA